MPYIYEPFLNLETEERRDEFFENQYAYCYDHHGQNGLLNCKTCVNAWHCKFDCPNPEYCSEYTHIEDTYGEGFAF